MCVHVTLRRAEVHDVRALANLNVYIVAKKEVCMYNKFSN